MKERRNAKAEEGREKVTAKGGVTRIVVSGSRTSELAAELFSAHVDDQRVTKDATVAGSECTRKAMEVSTRNGAEGEFLSVDEDVRRNQESKGTEETTFVSQLRDGGRTCRVRTYCRTQAKAPPQKRRAVIHVESAETQDYVSEPQRLEEREAKKKKWRS